MTETASKVSAGVGDVLTATAAMTIPNPAGGVVGINVQRGTVVTVTESLLEDTKDRTGQTWLSDLSESAQIARWGAVRFILGDASNSVLWWQNDPTATKLARDAARENANKISDAEQRAAALQEVHDTFGPDRHASGQVTLMHVAADADPHARRDAR